MLAVHSTPSVHKPQTNTFSFLTLEVDPKVEFPLSIYHDRFMEGYQQFIKTYIVLLQAWTLQIYHVYHYSVQNPDLLSSVFNQFYQQQRSINTNGINNILPAGSHIKMPSIFSYLGLQYDLRTVTILYSRLRQVSRPRE